MWAGETVQQVKALTSKPDNLSSIPSTHLVEGEDSPQVVLRVLLVQSDTCIHTHTHTGMNAHTCTKSNIL